MARRYLLARRRPKLCHSNIGTTCWWELTSLKTCWRAGFFWKNQQLMPSEKYGVRDCFVLKSTPGSQDRTYYDSVTSWIDRSILYPVHVVKTLRGTKQQKEFIYYGLRQVSGVWSASQVEAKQQGKPGSSMLVIEGGSAKANLTRKDFDISRSGAQAESGK